MPSSSSSSQACPPPPRHATSTGELPSALDLLPPSAPKTSEPPGRGLFPSPPLFPLLGRPQGLENSFFKKQKQKQASEEQRAQRRAMLLEFFCKGNDIPRSCFLGVGGARPQQHDLDRAGTAASSRKIPGTSSAASIPCQAAGRSGGKPHRRPGRMEAWRAAARPPWTATQSAAPRVSLVRRNLFFPTPAPTDLSPPPAPRLSSVWERREGPPPPLCKRRGRWREARGNKRGSIRTAQFWAHRVKRRSRCDTAARLPRQLSWLKKP